MIRRQPKEATVADKLREAQKEQKPSQNHTAPLSVRKEEGTAEEEVESLREARLSKEQVWRERYPEIH
jgi:hypothetical protein